MSDSAATIAERIRAMLLRGNPERQALQALAETHAGEVGKVNTMLARCQRWIQRGCASEALSLAEAGQVIPSAAALRLEGIHDAWSRLLDHAGLPPAPEIDVALLEALVAAESRQAAMAPQLGAMRLSFLRRAPLPDRLRALHALADREPRNPAWLEAVRRLEREAVAALADAAREAERTESPELACQVIERLDGMELRTDEHAELFARVRRIAQANRLLDVQRRARDVAESLHAAAAAMDLPALAAGVEAWERLCAEGDPGEALRREVEGPIDLHRRERERESLEGRRAEALAQLELALDQGGPIETLNRLADAADRLDAEWPAALRSRLQDRRDQHAAARVRRRARSLTLVVAVMTVLAAGGWWTYRVWSHERRFDDAIRESDRLVSAGELDSAEKVLDSVAQDPALAPRAELSGARLRLANARDRVREAQSAADALVTRLDQLAAAAGDPVEMERVARESSSLIDVQPATRRESVRAAIARLQVAAATARDRSLEALRGALHGLTERLEGVANPERAAGGKFDRAAWGGAADAYDAIARDARAAASTAAAQRDGQTMAESLQALAGEAAQRASKARTRADRIDLVRGTLKKLEQSTDEQATLDLWETLLREGGDVLADRGMLRACEAARDSARAGLGIRNWRASVIPSVLAGRGDVQRGLEAIDWGDVATARALDGALTRHLDEQPSTPYRPVAERLRGMARRVVVAAGAETSIGAAAKTAIGATGYAGLLEQPFEQGRTLYRRATEQPATLWGQAIESKRDLSKDPAALAARKPPAFKPLGSAKPWAGAAAVERAVAALAGADGPKARDAVLRMLVELREARGADPVLQWHATRDLWRIWLQMFADETDSEDAAAARWVRSLDGVTALLGEDPILLGAGESGARTDGVRRQALDQLSRAFDATRLIAAAQRRDAALVQGVRPLAPLGVMLPAENGSLGIATSRPGQRGAVPAREGDGWTLRGLRIEDGRAVWDTAAPEPPVTWPQVLFIPGGDA
jgi:uncharacterized protein YcbK (DUF882 family)